MRCQRLSMQQHIRSASGIHELRAGVTSPKQVSSTHRRNQSVMVTQEHIIGGKK